MPDLTPYSNVLPFVQDFQPWIPQDDRDRIASYLQYEKFYWNHPEAFKLSQRGTDDKPIYVPNAMTVVDVTSHYLLKDMTIAFAEQNDVQDLALEQFMVREGFLAKFHIAKHSGVVRGDWVMHLTADPEKPEGTRLSVNSVDPAAFFPRFDDDDLDRVSRVFLAEVFLNEDDELKIRRLHYFYVTEGGTRVVWREEGIFGLDDWGGPESSPERVLIPASPLPSDITVIPVYHFQNRPWQGDPFGSSEIRGFEVILGAINQSISDEQLALALEGLGVYTTDAAAPQNAEGQEVAWSIGPGKVIELPDGKKFARVDGLKSVTPSLEHVGYLEDALWEASGTTAVARGSIDVAVAEAGVALALKFQPTAAKLEARDLLGQTKLEQMFFDWKTWLAVFEGQDFRASRITVTLGQKLPEDRKQKFAELVQMLTDKVISRSYFREEVTKLGYIFPPDEELEAEIVSEEAALLDAMDLPGSRIDQELGDDAPDLGI